MVTEQEARNLKTKLIAAIYDHVEEKAAKAFGLTKIDDEITFRNKKTGKDYTQRPIVAGLAKEAGLTDSSKGPGVLNGIMPTEKGAGKVGMKEQYEKLMSYEPETKVAVSMSEEERTLLKEKMKAYKQKLIAEMRKAERGSELNPA